MPCHLLPVIIHLIFFNFHLSISRLYRIMSDNGANNKHCCFISDLNGNASSVLNGMLIDAM